MRTTVTVRSEADLLAVVPKILGFAPQDSVVVMSLGGGPTGRCDTNPIADLIAAFTPMLPHLIRGVALVGYGTGVTVLDEMEHWLTLNGIDVPMTVTANNGEGGQWDTGTPLDERQVLKSRAELERLAGDITDPAEAQAEAVAAYEAGDGALAWVFHDRSRTLLGYDTPAMSLLRSMLVNAVDPRRRPAPSEDDANVNESSRNPEAPDA